MRKLILLAAGSLIAASAFGAGEIYRWKDTNGTWHYSDQPYPGAELVRGAQRPVSDSAASAPPAPAAEPVLAATTDAPPLSDAATAQVRREAAAAKTEQCTKAQEVYQKAIQARRVYKTDDKGNRVFLTDAEIDAMRLQARSARDLACG